MVLKWIQAFVALAGYLNFSKAASSMYITQPSLSRYIAALEEEIGVKLFERDTHSVALTNAGAAFLPRAKEILRLSEEAVYFAKKVASEGSAEYGSLSIAIDKRIPPTDYYSYNLPRATSEFKEMYPGAEFDVKFAGPDNVNAWIKSEFIDVGISLVQSDFLDTPQARILDYMVITTDETAFLVPKKLEQMYSDGVPVAKILNGLKYFCIDNDSQFIAERLRSISIMGLISPITFCDSWNEVNVRVSMGEGFATMSKSAIRNLENSRLGMLCYEEFNYSETVHTVAIWKKGKNNALVKAFLDLFLTTS